MELALEVFYFLVLAFQDFFHLLNPLLKLLPLLLQKIKLLLHCRLLVFELTQLVLHYLYLCPYTLQGCLVVKTPSHHPFHHNHGLKHKEEVLDRKPRGMDGQKVDEYGYLSDGKKSRLPHCFREVIAQVLIILRHYNGRELLQGIFGVFAKEDGWLLLTSKQSLHEAFASSMLHWGDRLYTLSH